VAADCLDRHNAYLRGETIERQGALFPSTRLTALYVTAPNYFPDEFATTLTEDHAEIVLAWLVPITAEESHFVSHYGWSDFEDRLVRINPDLLDFQRCSIITAADFESTNTNEPTNRF
jgi:hypothetical protein